MDPQPIRLDQYVQELREKLSQEVMREDPENEWNLKLGKGISSPASELPAEELKMLQQSIHGQNLLYLGESLPHRKKELVLRKFFRHKRNQQIEVYSKSKGKSLQTLGKVRAAGRDFVVLTTLTDRIWIPFSAIHSANVPYGLPDLSNTHQHLVIDDNLRHKLITQFGQTVSNKDVLVQQFFEESLETNMQTWKGTRVEIDVGDQTLAGKVLRSKDGLLTIKSFNTEQTISLKEITYIKTVRFLQLLWPFFHRQNTRYSG